MIPSAAPRRLPDPRRAWILGCLFCWLAVVPGALAGKSIKVPLAEGFDLPVGKPDASGYYVFRGYSPNGHLGEDWNGNGGGNSDLGDPVYATADGVVTFSEDYQRGWGNVVILRHAYLDNGRVTLMDSLYGHLDKRTVRKYQVVKRGQQLGTIGTAHGKYWAHLHFEMRKDLRVGMARNSFPKDYSVYFSPRQFISTRRTLRGGAQVLVPVDTYDNNGSSEAPEKDPDLARNDTPSVVPTRKERKPVSREDASTTREAELQRLVDENKKKVDAMKEEDLDGFWARLKKKLGKKE